MYQTVNMIIGLEKELELERQGQPRTRRWIGDNRRVVDERWYRSQTVRTPEIGQEPCEGSQVVETGSRRETYRSALARLLRRPRASRQLASHEC